MQKKKRNIEKVQNFTSRRDQYNDPWLAEKLGTFEPTTHKFILWKYNKIDEEQGRKEANTWVRKLESKYASLNKAMNMDEDAIQEQADLYMKAYQKVQKLQGNQAALDFAQAMFEEYSASLPPKSERGLVLRLEEKSFWCKTMRKYIYRHQEQLSKEIGALGKYSHQTEYTSERTRKNRRRRLNAIKSWAEKIQIKHEDLCFPMEDLIKSKAKGYNAKLYAKIAGLRNLQDMHGYDACMITITCPGGEWREKATARDSIQHQGYVMQQITKRRKELDMNVAGMVCTQPHKDSISHQHMYVIGDRKELEKLINIVNNEALEKFFPDQKGAREQRVDVIWENKSIGRLSSYAARYVCRLAAVDDDQKPVTEKDGGGEDSWYSANAARRISWFGLLEDYAWDSLRTAKMVEGNTALNRVIKMAWEGNYAAVTQMLGGIGLAKSKRPYKAVREEYTTRFEETAYRYLGIEIYGAELLKADIDWEFQYIDLEERIVSPNCPRPQPKNSKSDADAVFDLLLEQAYKKHMEEKGEPIPI